MKYIALTRKYRPQTFDEVIGQEHITKTLKNAIKSKRVAHAYIFAGPKGVGKTTTARILAKAMNCVNGPTQTPCGKCASCIEIASSESVDVYEIDGASNRGIDEIRNLRENVKYASIRGKFKVYIIDEVHMLTTEAFNALLKTLEEPPAHVIFIFATTEPHRVIPTILSRCQRFDFRKLSIKEITNRIIYISKAEEIKIDEDALFLISKKADGSIRDAESMLDQLASYSEKAIKKDDVVTVLGLCEADVYFELANAFISKESSRCLDIIDRTINNGYDLHEFVIGCIEHMRALQLVKIGADLEELRYNLQRYKTQAQKFDADDLLRVLNIMCRLEVEMKRSMQPRTVVEATFLRISKLESSVRLSEIFDRLDRLESEFTKKKDKYLTLEDITEEWLSFTNKIKEKISYLGSWLAGAKPLKLEENRLTITFPSEGDFHKEYIESSNRAVIQEELKTYFGRELELFLKVEKKKEKSDYTKKDLLEDQIVKSAVTLLDGEIISTG